VRVGACEVVDGRRAELLTSGEAAGDAAGVAFGGGWCLATGAASDSQYLGFLCRLCGRSVLLGPSPSFVSKIRAGGDWRSVLAVASQ